MRSVTGLSLVVLVVMVSCNSHHRSSSTSTFSRLSVSVPPVTYFDGSWEGSILLRRIEQGMVVKEWTGTIWMEFVNGRYSYRGVTSNGMSYSCGGSLQDLGRWSLRLKQTVPCTKNLVRPLHIAGEYDYSAESNSLHLFESKPAGNRPNSGVTYEREIELTWVNP